MSLRSRKWLAGLAAAGAVAFSGFSASAWTTGFYCHPISVSDSVPWGSFTTNQIVVTCSNKDSGENGSASSLFYVMPYSATDAAANARASRLTAVIQAAILGGRTVRIDTDDNTNYLSVTNARYVYNFGLY
jgi:hypothetical protein